MLKKNLLLHCCRNLIALPTALVLTLASGLANADDTEIFFGQQSNQPNVLLILDTSGSMGDMDGTGITRLQRLKTALNTLLTTTNDINVGLMAYSGISTSIEHEIRPITENRDEILATINSLTNDHGTPTVAALHEGYLYFSGAPLPYTSRGRAYYAPFWYECTNPSIVDATCFDNGGHSGESRQLRLPNPSTYEFGPAAPVPAGLDITDEMLQADVFAAGYTYIHPHCTEDDLNHPSCVTNQLRGVVNYKSPIESECQSNHIVLLTDGQPTYNDTRANTIEAELPIDACVNVQALGYPSGGKCGVELTEHMANTDLSDSIDGINNVITHTIGLEFDEPWLISLSEGDNTSDGSGGNHYQASSTQSLLDAFEAIVGVAQTELNTFVAPAITVDQFSGLGHRDDIYLPLFIPSARSNWSGNLKRYRYAGSPPIVTDVNNNTAIDATGTFYPSAQSWWSAEADGNSTLLGGAASKLDADNRNVYTNISGNDLTDPDNQVHESNTLIDAVALGVDAGANIAELLQWTRGVDVLDYDDDPTTTTRKQMGDPLHSQPLLITYGRDLVTTAATDTTDPAVAAPANYTYNSVAFLGTNQGYLHAIDTQSGEEVFSFIPDDLLPNLNVFYNDERTVTKLYGLDGDLSSWVQDNNNNNVIEDTDHAYIYVGMRRGGRNYYALDVTDKNNPEVLWTIEGGNTTHPDFGADYANLGQTWSKLTPATIMHNGVKTKVLIFGGGYDAAQDNSTIRSADAMGNSLYIANAETGELIWKTNPTDHPEMIYSIPSDPSVIDVNGDGLADQIYVGDMGGQVWRFDLIANPTLNEEPIRGGVIANLASDTGSDVRRFFYRPDIAFIKGDDTTDSFLSIAIGSGNRAHPLEETVNDRFYMIKQFDISSAPEGYGMLDDTDTYRAITETDLYDVISDDIDSTDATVADGASNLLSFQGWKYELEAPGEKVLASSITLNGISTFVTYLPETSDEDICSPAIGRSRMYKVKIKNGSPANEDSGPYQDIEGSGIAATPYLYFDEQGNINEEIGLQQVGRYSDDTLQKTSWSEEPE